MSETVKSAIFGAVALASVLFAYAFQGNTGTNELPDLVGKPLFPEFTDALAAKSLTITRFDESLGKLNQLEVKSVDGIWRLPSHEGYPADAENKIRDATTPFIDLNIIRVVSDKESDHSLYGVLEPNSQSSQATDEGVGTLVEIRDGGGKSLVSLIIGKEVKDQEGQHYVRQKGKSQIYVCEVDPDALPVRFDEWIEKDLLKVSAFDIEDLTLKDYSFDLIPQAFSEPITSFNQRFEISLSYRDNEWHLNRLRENINGRFVDSQLLETEEIDSDRINDLRNALADLEIVDVDRKPAGLTAGLKADQSFFQDQEGLASLVERGFYPVQLDGQAEVLSSEGEVIAGTKDGVEYVLRFGRVEGLASDADDNNSLNRYLLISARVNEQKFQPPELQPLPDLPEKSDASDDPEAAAEKVADASEDDNESKSNESNPDVEADKAAEADNTDRIAEIQAERERIQKENQRKQDEYDEKIKAASEKVRDLNFRFADWYYVISEDMYKKIHLSRSDIVKESQAAKESGFGLDAFEKIREDAKELLDGNAASDSDTSE